MINALGLRAAPGQSLDAMVTVEEMTFAAEPIAQEIQSIEKASRWMGWVEAASRWGAMAAAVGVFIFFMRMLSRQRPEAVPMEILTLPAEVSGPLEAAGQRRDARLPERAHPPEAGERRLDAPRMGGPDQELRTLHG